MQGVLATKARFMQSQVEDRESKKPDEKRQWVKAAKIVHTLPWS